MDFLYYLVLLVFAGATIYLLFSNALNKYHQKELQELNTIDLKVFAAENNLHFAEHDPAYLNKLAQSNLTLGLKPNIKNIITRTDGKVTIRVFDASCVYRAKKTHHEIDLIGVSIESDSLSLPSFFLKPSMPLDRFTFAEELEEVDKKLLPQAIQEPYSLFHYKIDKPDRVIQLFSDKHKLPKMLFNLIKVINPDSIKIISSASKYYGYSRQVRLQSLVRVNFQMLAGSKHKLVLYQLGTLQSDISHARYMEQKGRELFVMFCELAPAELKTGKGMKISNQNQSNQS